MDIQNWYRRFGWRVRIFLELFSVFGAIFFGITHSAAAQELLAPIPGYFNNGTDLAGYLQNAYKLTIGIAGVLAVLMIVIGGIEYIFSAVPSAKSDAKNRINGAVFGLIIALTSYILLRTLNPELLNVGINLPPVSVKIPDSEYLFCRDIPGFPAIQRVCMKGFNYTQCQQMITGCKEAGWTTCQSPECTPI